MKALFKQETTTATTIVVITIRRIVVGEVVAVVELLAALSPLNTQQTESHKIISNIINIH